MNKKTITIISAALILAILVVAVIVTFPTYRFNDTSDKSPSSDTVAKPDENTVGGAGEGIEAILPDPDNLDNNNQDEQSGTAVTPSLDLKTIAQAEGAAVEAENGAFNNKTELKLKKLGLLNKQYHTVNYYTRKFAKKFVAYSFTAKQDGKDVLPIAYVRLAITAPTAYDINNIDVYYLLSGGGVQKLDFTVDKVSGVVYVKANVTGTFILVEKKPVEDTEDTSSKEEITSSDNISSEDTSSDENTSSEENNSSDNTSSETDDANLDTMNGWSPWR